MPGPADLRAFARPHGPRRAARRACPMVAERDLPCSGRLGQRPAVPVLAAVHAGEIYTGSATVADRPYFTAYAGVHSPGGDLIGMLYVGLPLDEMSA